MIDERQDFERVMRGFVPPDDSLERLVNRRDRKRRNQRIAAGIVGIAVFAAAVWIVTSVGSLDRSETSVVPAGGVTGPAETGPAETGPAETAPPPALAPGAPDEQGRCSNGAGSRLELTDIGNRIKVRYEVHRSPRGHPWRVRMWRRQPAPGSPFALIWRGVRVASDSGDFAVVRLHWDAGWNGYGVRAIDSATGEVCLVLGSIGAY